jgi:hypothetical protein
MTKANTLAYHKTVKITAVKKFYSTGRGCQGHFSLKILPSHDEDAYLLFEKCARSDRLELIRIDNRRMAELASF